MRKTILTLSALMAAATTAGAQSASALAEAGAACVTVIEDREGDIYECFAFKPANVEKLVLLGANGSSLDAVRLKSSDLAALELTVEPASAPFNTWPGAQLLRAPYQAPAGHLPSGRA